MRTVDRLQGTTTRLLRRAAGDDDMLSQRPRPRSIAPALQRMRDARFSSVVEPRVQAMRVSSPHDPAEHEAHATAQAIVGMAEPDEASAGVGPLDEVAEGTTGIDEAMAPIAGRPPVIARKADGPAMAPHGVMAGIARARGMGRPLPSHVRRFMEPRFRADFSGVRIHTGDHAARLNRQLSAHAFTFGDEVFFGRDRFQPETREGRELIAHELTHTIQQGAVAQDRSETVQRSAAPAVSSSATPHLQRLGVQDVLDFFADKANLIPGFRMFTIVLGVNPVNMRSVDRSAANILRAVVEFLPGGNLITRVLDSYGVFDKAGAWVEGQLASLGISGASIKAAIDRFLDSLSWTDIFDLGGVWDRAKAILGDPVSRILTFIGTLFGAILDMIKDAVLRPLAQLASQTAGWDLLCAVLGRNPITGDPVPRNAETLIGGFMKLIGQEEIWENIKKGNAIARAWAWFQGAVEGALGFVREFPTLFLGALKSLTIEDLVLLPQAFIKVGRAFGDFIGRFLSWAGGTIWDLLEIIFSVVAPSVIVYIKKAAAAFKTILKNPIGFVKNLVEAGKQGLGRFASNFVTHLQKALLNWLTGALSGAGIYIPQALSLVEFGKLALSVFGVSWPQIRTKIVKVLPGGETTMKVLEASFDVVVALVKGGPAAAWEVIKDKLAGLRDTILQGIISFVTESIVTAAIKRLISFLVPGGAFIQAILTIVDTITVFVQKLKDIAAVVAAFIDSIDAIANGQLGAAAGRVEAALGSALNVVVAFLAKFVGLGKVTDKIVDVVKKLQARVDKALDAAIAWIVEKAKALFGRGRGAGAELGSVSLSLTGTPHTLSVKGQGGATKVIMQSAPLALTVLVRDVVTKLRKRAQDARLGPETRSSATAAAGDLSAFIAPAMAIEVKLAGSADPKTKAQVQQDLQKLALQVGAVGTKYGLHELQDAVDTTVKDVHFPPDRLQPVGLDALIKKAVQDPEATLKLRFSVTFVMDNVEHKVDIGFVTFVDRGKRLDLSDIIGEHPVAGRLIKLVPDGDTLTRVWAQRAKEARAKVVEATGGGDAEPQTVTAFLTGDNARAFHMNYLIARVVQGKPDVVAVELAKRRTPVGKVFSEGKKGAPPVLEHYKVEFKPNGSSVKTFTKTFGLSEVSAEILADARRRQSGQLQIIEEHDGGVTIRFSGSVGDSFQLIATKK